MHLARRSILGLLAFGPIMGVSAGVLANRSPKGLSFTPQCDEPVEGQAFCKPKNNSNIYVGEKMNIIWNPAFFQENATVTIVLQYLNRSKQAWSSKPTPKEIGFVSVKLQEDWLNGYDAYNLTFVAQEHVASKSESSWAEGPFVTLTNAPPHHYPAEIAPANPDNNSLVIALPVVLGFVALMVLGLWFGKRHTRRIRIENLMGRKRGYDTGRSRRQRMGISKKDNRVHLAEAEAEAGPDPMYRDEPRTTDRLGQQPNISLGSLVSEDAQQSQGTQGNVFRQEIERQRTGH